MKMESLVELEGYIRKKLVEIEDVEERKFAKQIMLEGLLPIFQYTEKCYAQLEERIKSEVEICGERYAVCMTVINENDYDPINGTLFPICTDVSNNYLYFSGNYKEKLEFEKKTEWNAYDELGEKHTVHIRRVNCYMQAVKDLYKVFVYNKVDWTTINTCYLERFYEMYSDEDIGDISQWKIDFGDMSEKVLEGMIPLWNIERFNFHCNKFMVPCIDDKYYEHELNLEEYDSNSRYMLGINEDVLKIRHEKNKIIMTSLKESFRNWCAYRFVENIDVNSQGYKYELIHNYRKKSFFKDYLDTKKLTFRSSTDIFRELQSFECEQYIELISCEVTETVIKDVIVADMNFFIKEETFPIENRKNLVLYFKRKTDFVFIEEMVRFFVSQIQIAYFEYRCVGVLVES